MDEHLKCLELSIRYRELSHAGRATLAGTRYHGFGEHVCNGTHAPTLKVNGAQKGTALALALGYLLTWF